jgi:hypothetical protein
MQQQTNITVPTVFSRVQLEKSWGLAKIRLYSTESNAKAGCPFATFFRHQKGK